MKSLLSAFAMSAILLSGCAAPLRQDAASADVGKALGVSSANISFVSYCSFGNAPPSGHHVSFEQGVITVTRDSVALMKGDPASATVAHRIRFIEMRGVDVHHFGFGRQLQIKTQTEVIVIEVSKNKGTIDREGTERVRSILREHGVPDWKSDTHYLMKPKGPIFVPIPLVR